MAAGRSRRGPGRYLRLSAARDNVHLVHEAKNVAARASLNSFSEGPRRAPRKDMQNPSAGLESSGGSAVNSKPPARNTDECMKFNPPIRWGLKRHAAHKCESRLEDAEESIGRRSDFSDFSREFFFFFLSPFLLTPVSQVASPPQPSSFSPMETRATTF